MPNLSKEQNKQMTADQIMASLGLATRLSEQLLKQQNPMQSAGEPMQETPQEAYQTLETAPGEEEMGEMEEMPMEEETVEPEPEEPEEPSFVTDLKSMITEGFENIKGLFKKEDKEE